MKPHSIPVPCIGKGIGIVHRASSRAQQYHMQGRGPSTQGASHKPNNRRHQYPTVPCLLGELLPSAP